MSLEGADFLSSNGTVGVTDGRQGSDGRGSINLPISGDNGPKVTFSISNKKDKECRLRPSFPHPNLLRTYMECSLLGLLVDANNSCVDQEYREKTPKESHFLSQVYR